MSSAAQRFPQKDQYKRARDLLLDAINLMNPNATPEVKLTLLTVAINVVAGPAAAQRLQADVDRFLNSLDT